MTSSRETELFVKLPKWRWRSNLEHKSVWTLDELYIHLAFCADERLFAAAPFPSRRRLVALTGLTEARVRRALADHRRWVPSDRLAQWEQTMIEDGRIRVAKPRRLPPEEQARKEEDALRYVRPPRQRRRTSYDDETMVAEIERRIRRRNWTALKGQDAAQLLSVVRRVLEAVLQRDPTAPELSSSRWCVLAALRQVTEASGTDVVDMEAFVADVELVARAARESNQHLFRVVRGMIGRERRYPDQSRNARFLLYAERWAERLEAAKAWQGADASSSAGVDACDGAEAALRELDQDAAMSVNIRLALDPREDIRRREALVTALFAQGDVPLDCHRIADMVTMLRDAGFRRAFVAAYAAGVDPPPEPS